MIVHPSSLTDVVTLLEEELQKLRFGVVANAGRRARVRRPRWAHVSDATGFGSTASVELCRQAGFDPEEYVP